MDSATQRPERMVRAGRGKEINFHKKNLRLITQTDRRIRQVYEGRYSMHIARRTTKTKLGGRERLVGDRAEVSL
jgi:hypothetical protein